MAFGQYQLPATCNFRASSGERLVASVAQPRDLCQRRPNKHSLEEFWYLADLALEFSKAPAWLQFARLGLISTQAKRPVHGGWRRTSEVFPWPLNVKSTSRHGSPSAHCFHVVNFAILWLLDFSQLERVCSVVAVAGLQVMRSPLGCNVEIRAIVCQMTTPSWRNIFRTLPLQLGSGIFPGKTSNRTSAWWLISNLRSVPPLSVTCQMNNQKSRASSKRT